MTRYYGDGTTIHSTGYVDVETFKGRVVAVWYRCSTLPFKETKVDAERAKQMEGAGSFPISAIVFHEDDRAVQDDLATITQEQSKLSRLSTLMDQMAPSAERERRMRAILDE